MSPPRPTRVDRAGLRAPAQLSQEGFTLIEVLVALVITAIAAVGLVGATEAYVDRIRGMEARTAAQWVAENKIVEMTVSGSADPVAYELVPMLGETWRVQVVSRPSDDPELAALAISVGRLNSSESLVTMDFFVDRRRGQP
jgi:general secretion pathway protein I